MRFKDKVKGVSGILKVRIFKKRIPLAVRWQLTYKCPLECKYCRIWSINLPELNTGEVFLLLDEMAKCGTRKISFSGGEPMMRKDIGEIINYCISRKMSPEMNSTGFLIPQNIALIKKLDLLKLSLDGPEEVHDLIRGKRGAYRIVIKAAEAAFAEGVKFIFTTTLTKLNLNHTRYIVELAEKFDTYTAFQPLKEISYGCAGAKTENLYPSEAEYKSTIELLISMKKSRKDRMRNSLQGLRHIYNWPRYKKLICYAGQIFCMLAPNGDLYPCDRLDYKEPLPNCIDLGFRRAFDKLPEIRCSGCGFCGSLELNYLAAFKWGILPTLKEILDK